MARRHSKLALLCLLTNFFIFWKFLWKTTDDYKEEIEQSVLQNDPEILSIFENLEVGSFLYSICKYFLLINILRKTIFCLH